MQAQELFATLYGAKPMAALRETLHRIAYDTRPTTTRK
jgi:hypothetical protein